MNPVYGRRYSLVIGRPGRADYTNARPPSSIAKPMTNGEYQESIYSREVNNVNVDTSFGDDRTVIPVEFREWTNTQMTADIDSSKEGDTDNNTKTTIKLWNLSKEEQLFIKKGYAVILRAGYNQDISGNEPPPGIASPDFNADPKTLGSKDLPLVFVGEILSVSTEKQGEDTETEIICTDGSWSFKGIRVSKTYPGVWNYYDIIEDMIRTGTIKYGVRFGNIFEGQVMASLIYQPTIDYVVNGYFLDELSRLCNSIGYKAFFCLGKIYIEPKYEVARKPTVNYRDDSELYYIRKEDDSNGEVEGSNEDLNAIEFAGPLDGRMSVVTQVRIGEGDYEGEWSVTSVAFKLDYEGTDWDVIVRAKAI